MLLVIGVTFGILMGLLVPFHVSSTVSPYVAIAIIAGLDSVFGGIVANFNGNFKVKVFITGFFTNAILAAAMAYLGNLLGVDLFLAAIVVFGSRLFSNLAIIRRQAINKYTKGDTF